MALTPEQEKRYQFLQERIARDREEQRILDALNAGRFITEGEKSAQIQKAESLPEVEEKPVVKPVK